MVPMTSSLGWHSLLLKAQSYVVPESSGAPDDVPDFFPEQLDSIDDILSSDARVMEEFATGSKIKNPSTKMMNNTVIKGTPLQNSIKPTDIYLINGNSDLLPRAKAIPIGKQKIKQKNEIIKVNDKPPQAPVSTQFNPSNFPNSINSS